MLTLFELFGQSSFLLLWEGRSHTSFFHTTPMITSTFFQHRDVHRYTWCRELVVSMALTDIWIDPVDFFHSNQCWTFVSKEVQNWRLITTWWSATYVVKIDRACTIMMNDKILPDKVGGPGGQCCKKVLCRQRISSLFQELSKCTTNVG